MKSSIKRNTVTEVKAHKEVGIKHAEKQDETQSKEETTAAVTGSSITTLGKASVSLFFLMMPPLARSNEEGNKTKKSS
jgi:hypothetical protein